nr:MAG TPA: hypothetical protein [Caudoviricetes sp.]
MPDYRPSTFSRPLYFRLAGDTGPAPPAYQTNLRKAIPS